MDGKAENPTGAELMTALSAVIDVEPADLPDQTVIDGLTEMIDLAGRLDAAMARCAAVFDSRALGAIDGARTTSQWLTARTELSRNTAHGLVNCGRGLRTCEHLDAAAREGRLGRAKVNKLLAARKEIEDVFDACEQDLIAEIEPMTVNRACRFIDQWRDSVLELLHIDGPEPATDPGRNEVHLSRTSGNRWLLKGALDAIGGEALASAIDDWIDRRVHQGALDPTDPRGRAGHRADALLALTGAGADHQTGTHQPRAQINLSWDADDLLGKDITALADLDRHRCNTTRGTTLAHHHASELMCNADITDLLVRFGYHSTRTILGVAHTRRHPTDKERRALDQRDQGCVFPGCDAPANWCHAHHITPYRVGRTTKLDDLVLLCAHHHRAVHRHFHLARDHTTGHVAVTRSDGTTIRTAADHPASGRGSPHPLGQGTKLPLHPPPRRPPRRHEPPQDDPGRAA